MMDSLRKKVRIFEKTPVPGENRIKMDTMRWLDDYIGSTLCFILTILKKTYDVLTLKAFRARKPLSARKINNILFIKFFGMGSIILVSPVIKAVKEKYPQARIFFMTFASNQEILELLDVGDVHLFIRRNNIFAFFFDIANALIKLNMARIDLAFDLEFFSRFTVILLLLSGAKVRVGYFLRKVWRGNFLTHQIYFNHFKHITRGFSAILEPLGIDEKCIPKPVINMNGDKAPSMDEIARKHKLSLNNKDAGIICINVNSSELSIDRRWPKENFRHLAQRLLKHSEKIFLVFIGSASERGYVQSVISSIENDRDRMVNLSGEISLKELVVLFAHSKMLITSDSGPLHLASASQTPTVSLFGPESPIRYGPLGNNHIVFCKNLYCSPCLNVYNAKKSMCNSENKCMQLISVEEVFDGICKSFPEIVDV